jgi:hypothetical protein
MLTINVTFAKMKDGSEYIPDLVEQGDKALTSVAELFETVASWKKKGKLTAKLDKAVWNSSQLMGMTANMRKRAQWATKSFAARLADAIVICGKTTWTNKAPANDKYRTQLEQQIWHAANSQRSYYCGLYELRAANKVGKKRMTKEQKAQKAAEALAAKNVAALKESAALAAAITGDPVKDAAIATATAKANAAKSGATVSAPAPQSFILTTKAQGPRDGAAYLLNLRDGMMATRGKNPDAFKGDILEDVFRKVVKEFTRLETAKDKI